MLNLFLGCFLGALLLPRPSTGFSVGSSPAPSRKISVPLYQSTPTTESVSVVSLGDATELPDSLEDAAVRAAEASAALQQSMGPLARCRVDFDPSVGDETYTLLKASTEFMQHYVTSLCYALVPGAQQLKQTQLANLVQAQAELAALSQQEKGDDGSASEEEKEDKVPDGRREELLQIIANEGRDVSAAAGKWKGMTARVYFPDEGSAALARRDWTSKVPPCVEFASCGGRQSGVNDIGRDCLVFFFCPKASESDSVEEILLTTEQTSAENLKLTVFVNPNLVDMGVTGFGLAGRRLRERLIDKLQHAYYLRTLPWGALTRSWPRAFSVWQEDPEAADGSGYRLIKTLDRLPSNPEVEDIYDVENGLMEAREGGGVLDQLGDFVNGMMKM